MRSASPSAFWESTGSSVPGINGAPASCAVLRAAALSPMRSIDSADGPMNVRPAAVTARTKSAFSARNPYPGCTIVAFAFFATSRMRGMFR